jgi:hypothetical protein
MEGNDVDDHPTPIIKCPITINFCSGVCLEFSIVDVMNMQSFIIKSNKMSISNINKHYQKTINSYFRIVWYNEDIMMGLFPFKLHIM